MFAIVVYDGCCGCSIKRIIRYAQNGTGYFYGVKAECILCGETSYDLTVKLDKVMDITKEFIEFVQWTYK